MSDYYQEIAKFGGIPKPEPRKKTKARAKRVQSKDVHMVRMYIFARERTVCRCCRARMAESMHEIVSRGRRGKVSRTNSIAVCGTIVGAVPSCHTYLQQSQILVQGTKGVMAEGALTFTALSNIAAEWMKIKAGESIESPTMFQCEVAE